MSILTVTLHPAVDRVLRIDRFRPDQASRAKLEMVYGGGKGNNAARALTRLGMPVTATGFQGGSTGEFLKTIIEEEVPGSSGGK